jgi:Ca2+-binding EF-hand superfamily protein
MRTAFIITAGLLAALALQAQDQQRPGGRGRVPMSPGFFALDSNADGILDAKEIEAAPAALAKLDKNGDGKITADEVRPPMPEGRGRGERGPEGAARPDPAEETVKMLMSFDANGDGKLSRAELPERFQGLFDRAGVAPDGFLTPDQIRKLAAATAPPPADAERGDREEREGGRGGPGGRGGRGEMNFIRMDPILAAIDANGDGILSAEEIRNAPAAIRKLDKDGNGEISREEAMPPMGRRGGN